MLSFEDILSLPKKKPDFRIAYGGDPLQFGELRLPPGSPPHPVALLVHGGCWRARYTVGHIGALADALTGAGIATFSVEYRRVGDPGGGWPGTFDDLATAVEHLPTIASEHGLDLERLIAVGHSAGGQLALWLATQSKIPLRRVVSLAGIPDLRRAVAEGVCDDMAAQLLGGTPDEFPQRYAEASPIERLPLGCPLHLVHGALDPIVPPDFSHAFAQRSGTAGDDVTLSIVPNAGHFELISPKAPAFEAVLTACRQRG